MDDGYLCETNGDYIRRIRECDGMIDYDYVGFFWMTWLSLKIIL